jgi:phage protein D
MEYRESFVTSLLRNFTVAPQKSLSSRFDQLTGATPNIAARHVFTLSPSKFLTSAQGEPMRRLRHCYPTEDSARCAAQAELDKMACSEHKLTLTMPGDPMLSAELPLVVSGFREGVDGNWLIIRATHILDKNSGYQCEIEADKPNSETAGSEL